MMVCAHGNVVDFCEQREMTICETWDGDLRDYKGYCRVLVTDSEMSENEYYFLKGEMLARGIELISTRYKDDKLMVDFLAYSNGRRKEKYTGRLPYGFYRKDGRVLEIPEAIAIARRVIELHDEGLTIRRIQETEGICNSFGKPFSVSTIQKIIKNRGKYENGI